MMITWKASGITSGRPRKALWINAALVIKGRGPTTEGWGYDLYFVVYHKLILPNSEANNNMLTLFLYCDCCCLYFSSFGVTTVFCLITVFGFLLGS
ncbi:hypothetical protein RvY_01167-2 [Ramazzottius varieornatus]|uniref:Uncharacterized protein n=1 Tax=Ramazzottius varieornatus TaxID=947166 RepID=A0A1D1UFC6_RAMVA|nr:hypothetical protein RvY_01167-2 [Ramazzottius varieornatus]